MTIGKHIEIDGYTITANWMENGTRVTYAFRDRGFRQISGLDMFGVVALAQAMRAEEMEAEAEEMAQAA